MSRHPLPTGKLLAIVPDVLAKLADIGMAPAPLPSTAHTVYIAAETKKWAPVVAAAKSRIE